MVKRIIEDTRPIQQINLSGDYQTNDFEVGKYGVTKIIPYEEKGPADFITFLAVYRGEEIWVRLPAGNLLIVYGASA